MFLLDTNVVSEQRKPRPHGALAAWLTLVPPEHLFLSAMTIAEIQAGVERTRNHNPHKAVELESWLVNVITVSQILPMDENVAREWARMMHRSPKYLENDAWIAATAKFNGLTLATRNGKDFAGFGIDIFDPFADTRRPV